MWDGMGRYTGFNAWKVENGISILKHVLDLLSKTILIGYRVSTNASIGLRNTVPMSRSEIRCGN